MVLSSEGPTCVIVTFHDFWWLVEVPYWWNWPCFVTFWGIFPHEVKDIIFAYARWDWNEVTLENSELRKTQISFLGGGDLWWVRFGYVRWGMRGEVHMWGGRGDLWWGLGVRWGPCEVRFGWSMTFGGCGEVCKVGYARWGMWGGICKVRFTWGETYVRWDLHEVSFMRGEIYMRWDLHKVRYARWDLCESPAVKFFTPWYFLYLLKTQA